jgi:hypothetical protein
MSHMLQLLHTYVSSVSSVFRFMLQMFHLDVSKVDLGVAHVALATHACLKCFIYF